MDYFSRLPSKCVCLHYVPYNQYLESRNQFMTLYEGHSAEHTTSRTRGICAAFSKTTVCHNTMPYTAYTS